MSFCIACSAESITVHIQQRPVWQSNTKVLMVKPLHPLHTALDVAATNKVVHRTCSSTTNIQVEFSEIKRRIFASQCLSVEHSNSSNYIYSLHPEYNHHIQYLEQSVVWETTNSYFPKRICPIVNAMDKLYISSYTTYAHDDPGWEQQCRYGSPSHLQSELLIPHWV